MATNHPFERAGLGLAPFQYAGYREAVFQAHPGAPVQPGATCDYCGTGIRHCFMVRSADGRTFKVGSDCIEKTCRPGGPIETAAKKALKAAKKTADAAKLQERVTVVRALLDASPDLLRDRGHPNEWRASCGDTGRDYVEFLLRCGGAKGRADACRIVERAV